MRPLRRLHSVGYAARRMRVLSDHLAALAPREGSLLDVGCGDAAITERIAALRPELSVHGLEVFVRAETRVPVTPYDGRRIPHPDASFDAVLFVDVLHHCSDPGAMLREGARVARQAVLVKDHLCESALDGALLRFMDRVGNPSAGVEFPSNFWSREQWQHAFAELDLEPEVWLGTLRLFPGPLDWIFGRSLHFVARLAPGGAG